MADFLTIIATVVGVAFAMKYFNKPKMVEKPKQVINFIERNKLRIREKSDMNQLKPQTILNQIKDRIFSCRNNKQPKSPK